MKRILATVAVLFAFAYGLLTLSRSTTYQLFGEIAPRVETNEKVVALTFDDGPTPFAQELLQTLAAKNVHGTFFLIGAEIAEDSADARAIAVSGNQIGNHSGSHDRMVFKTPSFIASEIENADREIRKAGYQGEIQVRPPYGKKLVGLPWYLAQHHRKTIMWDVDPLTDRNVDRSTDRIVAFVLARVRPGSIVLAASDVQRPRGDARGAGADHRRIARSRIPARHHQRAARIPPMTITGRTGNGTIVYSGCGSGC